MKQQIIELKKKLLLVERDGVLSQGWIDIYNTHQIIGKLTDIKEEQFEEWVEIVVFKSDPLGYRDYRFNKKNSIRCFATAKESFFSKVESIEIYFENKLGEYPTKYNTGLEYGMEYISKQASWEEVQENVWNLGNCYIFEIL